MSIWFLLWLALAGVAALVWFARACTMGTVLRKRQVLGADSYDGPPRNPPRISVLVAAKDEEDNIEACVTSLLDQDYPNYEVIVIDDRSTDGTPGILRRLEQGAGGKLRVVTVKTLREGWFGKNNAMRAGVEAATGDWLCFSDADCWQTSRKTLSVAMGEALEHGTDLLSITPLLETTRIWEKILQPICAITLIIWFLPERVNDPSKKTAYANGAFMLMRRGCYQAIGGHERVRTEVNEDIHMARLTKQAGLRLRVLENDELYRVRMYRTLPEAWRGWSRIYYGCLGTLPRLGIAAFLVTVFSIIPWLSLFAALAGCVGAAPTETAPWSLATGMFAAAVLLEQTVIWRIYGIMKITRSWSLFYLFAGLVVLGMLINAMFKTIGATATTWRGTTYRGDRLETAPTVPAPGRVLTAAECARGRISKAETLGPEPEGTSSEIPVPAEPIK